MLLRRHRCRALALAIPFAFGTAIAQGTEGASAKQRQAELAGAEFWVYPGHTACKHHMPTITTANSPFKPLRTPSEPFKVRIVGFAPGSHQTKFDVIVGDDTAAHSDTWNYPTSHTEPNDYHLNQACVLPWSPEARLAILAEQQTRRDAQRRQDEEAATREAQALSVQRSKPPARVGMSAKQVAEGTRWGLPRRVNRTETAEGSTEQWVYDDGNFLYFKNGRLTAIRTTAGN